MTHRLALVLSIALTLILGAGVVVGRDRLFAAESVASPATTTTEAAKSPSGNPGDSITATSPRIIEVSLPRLSGSDARSPQSRTENDERSLNRGGDDREEAEHEGEYDDD